MVTEVGGYNNNTQSSAEIRKGVNVHNYGNQTLMLTATLPAPLKSRRSYTASKLLEYEGWNMSGVATTIATWTIRKLTYVDNLRTQENWAFNVAWDSRAGATYE